MASSPSTRSLIALAFLNFFLADARDGLGPFLDGFLATRGWSPFTLGVIATMGGLLGMAATPFFGALVDKSTRKRLLIVVPIALVTAAALWTLLTPNMFSVFGGQALTAVVGAVIGPAVMGLTLGLVGQKAFSGQVARNEIWNHAGNVASLAAVFVASMVFGLSGVIGLMIFTALAASAAAGAILSEEIDHEAARGGEDDGDQGFRKALAAPGLWRLAVVLLIFHFGNAPISRLIAQQFSIELGSPFQTTAITTGVSQLSMIVVAAVAPFALKRFGLSALFIVALAALPLRGALAGLTEGFVMVYPIQILDGVGAGLIGIATPIAAERILAGTGRFNTGLAAVMTVQGVGAALSNIAAGFLTKQGGYGLAYLAHGGVAIFALIAFMVWRSLIAPHRPARKKQNPAI
jgi:MFS family permease